MNSQGSLKRNNTNSKSSLRQYGDKQLQQTRYTNSSCTYFDDNQFQAQSTIQEDCLHKLRMQRQKIQEMTYLYQGALQQIKHTNEQVKRLEVQMIDYEQLKQIKLKYFALTNEFSDLSLHNVNIEQKNEKLKQKISQLLKQNEQIVKLSDFQKMKLKEQNSLTVNHYLQIVKDKQDQITRINNIFEVKQTQYQQTIHNNVQTINDLKVDIQQYKNQTECHIQSLNKDKLKKDEQIEKMNHALDHMKDQNKILRTQLRKCQKEFADKQKQWLQTQDDLIHQINQLKRKLNDENNLTNQLKYKLSKCQQKLKGSIDQSMVLKDTLKRSQQQLNKQLDDLTHHYEQKLAQYKNHQQQLKQSLEQLLQVKDILLKQNQGMKQKLQKDNQDKIKRRLLMREEIREIQKMQYSMKRNL